LLGYIGQGDNKSLQIYYEHEIRQRKRDLIKKLTKEVGYKKSFAQRVIGEFHSKGLKFKYPKNLNTDKRAILKTDLGDMYNEENYKEDPV
jgi:hypothetical protein